jgi:hypothetical protein
MFSLDALMGRGGYRLLLQTGESADGRTHLLDRQHPHDVPMEGAVMYGVRVAPRSSVFLYAAWPGEPALGPPAFMHRGSAMAIPSAPIGHHWMDSTHITFGVLTAGLTHRTVKIDGSVFNGREPDARRWGWEHPRLDSYAARVTLNPHRTLSLQASAGRIRGPERLHPGIDADRVTVSATWSSIGGATQLTAAWGRNIRSQLLPDCLGSAACAGAAIPYAPSRVTDAVLLEAALRVARRHLVFARGERVAKDELYPGLDPFHSRVFPVGAAQAGYLVDLLPATSIGLRVGAAVSLSFVPAFIAPDYGQRPVSYWVFAHARLR